MKYVTAQMQFDEEKENISEEIPTMVFELLQKKEFSKGFITVTISDKEILRK